MGPVRTIRTRDFFSSCNYRAIVALRQEHEKRGHSAFSTRPESKATAFVPALINQDDVLALHMGVSMVNENVPFFLFGPLYLLLIACGRRLITGRGSGLIGIDHCGMITPPV